MYDKRKNTDLKKILELDSYILKLRKLLFQRNNSWVEKNVPAGYSFRRNVWCKQKSTMRSYATLIIIFNSTHKCSYGTSLTGTRLN